LIGIVVTLAVMRTRSYRLLITSTTADGADDAGSRDSDDAGGDLVTGDGTLPA
jgi:hypothetical protein